MGEDEVAELALAQRRGGEGTALVALRGVYLHRQLPEHLSGEGVDLAQIGVLVVRGAVFALGSGVERHRAVRLFFENDGRVRIVARVARPHAGERVEVDALQKPGIVHEIAVIVVDGQRVLHARLVGDAGAEHVAVYLRVDGDRPRLRVVVRIELDKIEDGVFAHLQHGIGLAVHERRGVKSVPGALGKRVVAVEEEEQLLVDEAEDARADIYRMAVGLGDALPHVEQRITARVYGDAALDGRADVDGRARGLPVVEVKEVDAPVQRGIDDLRQRPALLFLAHVHDAHDFFRPAHDGALARPAHAAPVVDLADGHAPDDLQLFRVVRDIAVGGAVAVVIAAESGHALHIRVFAGKPHVDLRRAGVGIHALAVLHGDALQAELRWRGNDLARAAQPGADGGHGRSGGGRRGGRARRGGDDCVDRGGRGDGGRHARVRPAAEQRAQQQRQQQRQRRDDGHENEHARRDLRAPRLLFAAALFCLCHLASPFARGAFRPSRRWRQGRWKRAKKKAGHSKLCALMTRHIGRRSDFRQDRSQPGLRVIPRG